MHDSPHILRNAVSAPVPIPGAIGTGRLDICEDGAFHEHLDHGAVSDHFTAAAQQGWLLIHQMILRSDCNVRRHQGNRLFFMPEVVNCISQ